MSHGVAEERNRGGVSVKMRGAKRFRTREMKSAEKRRWG